MVAKPGKRHRLSEEERLALVRRYLAGDEPAQKVADDAGVKLRQFRNWVAELRDS